MSRAAPTGSVRGGWILARTALLALSVVWPLTLVAATQARVHAHAPMAAAVVYLAAGLVCHQKPERSFHTQGTPWPVCGRCSGLYFGASFGAILAWWRRRGPAFPAGSLRWLLAASAIPTALTIGFEWTGVAPVGNLARALAAWPLGFTVGWLLLEVLPVAYFDQVH